MSHKVRCVLYELLIARTFHHSSSFGFTAFAFIFMVGGRRFGDSLLVMANSLTLHRVPQSWMAPNIFYSFRRRIIWTEDLFAQYVVFLCSCDYFFHAHFFYSTIPMLNVGVFYVSCVLRTLQQFTCIRILLDLLWLSAPKKGSKKYGQHLSIYALAKKNNNNNNMGFFPFFHILFSKGTARISMVTLTIYSFFSWAPFFSIVFFSLSVSLFICVHVLWEAGRQKTKSYTTIECYRNRENGMENAREKWKWKWNIERAVPMK